MMISRQKKDIFKFIFLVFLRHRLRKGAGHKQGDLPGEAQHHHHHDHHHYYHENDSHNQPDYNHHDYDHFINHHSSHDNDRYERYQDHETQIFQITGSWSKQVPVCLMPGCPVSEDKTLFIITTLPLHSPLQQYTTLIYVSLKKEAKTCLCLRQTRP